MELFKIFIEEVFPIGYIPTEKSHRVVICRFVNRCINLGNDEKLKIFKAFL